jgi:hypothetical protein
MENRDMAMSITGKQSTSLNTKKDHDIGNPDLGLGQA